MSSYKIQYIRLPENVDTSYANPISTRTTMKEIFWDNNLSLLTCIAMLLGQDINKIQKSNPNFLLYGKCLGGFAYEGFELLPPLCILQVLINEEPRNTVYYNRKVYDPMIGIFNIHEYVQKILQVVSYIQIFIPFQKQAH